MSLPYAAEYACLVREAGERHSRAYARLLGGEALDVQAIEAAFQADMDVALNRIFRTPTPAGG